MKKESPDKIEEYFDRLWPILRSITGEGVRQSHDILSEIIPLKRFEIPTGSKVYDWEIPKEWAVSKAYVINPEGKKILDIKDNNLHLVNYSIPFTGTVGLAELNKHLYSLPDLPDAIPYITSYYKERWGFCISENERQRLSQGDYQVVIDSKLFDGSLTIGEAFLQGESDEEVLISSYSCHPSMANNELSGPLVLAFLYKRLAQVKNRRLSYRFVLLPETIGAIAYLNMRGEHLKEKLTAGYVVTCIGDAGDFTYKRSRQHNSLADKAALHVLATKNAKVINFSPLGSDERQYCSPAFNLPMGSLMRTMYGEFPEYHTSLDNKEFISFTALQESIDVYFDILMSLDKNQKYINLYPHGEPRLDKRGLYESIGHSSVPELSTKVLWLLNYSDGEHDLLDIANLSGYSVNELHEIALICLRTKLIKQI